jgi:ABC-type polysaccharide/polyol phosphate export permease
MSLLMYFISFFLAIICVRFTDVKHLINSSIQLLFYITPVIWQPHFLSEKYQDYLLLNPLYWFMSILRDPLIGSEINIFPWLLTLGTLVLAIVAIPIFVGKYVRRLIFWI